MSSKPNSPRLQPYTGMLRHISTTRSLLSGSDKSARLGCPRASTEEPLLAELQPEPQRSPEVKVLVVRLVLEALLLAGSRLGSERLDRPDRREAGSEESPRTGLAQRVLAMSCELNS